MRLQNRAKKKLRPLMAMLLAFLMVFGTLPLTAIADASGPIVATNSALPNNPTVSVVGTEFTHSAYVTMNGKIISSIRYVVNINGVYYEAFCADPDKPGPETNASVYELTGADGEKYRTVLSNGFPVNPALSQNIDDEERAWNVYMTRVAVAYVNRPDAAWGRLDGSTKAAVDNRINGTGGATAKANFPAITVNGDMNSSSKDETPQSPSFKS